MARTRKPSPKGFSEPRPPYDAPRAGGAGAESVAQGSRRLPAPEMLPDGTIRYFLVLGPKGRVLLPADMRRAMGLEEGDVITAWLKDGEVRMHSHLYGLRKIQAGAPSMPNGRAQASDELIAERRAEVAKEAEEASQRQRARKGRRR